MLDQILHDLVASVKGASAAIFVDGDGESIAQVGELSHDIKLLGAWKEIHLDSIKEITKRLGLGTVHAVLFSHDDGNEIMAPVADEYCLIIFTSPYTDIGIAIRELPKTISLLKKDIE